MTRKPLHRCMHCLSDAHDLVITPGLRKWCFDRGACAARVKELVSPGQGGCWFCYRTHEPLLFDTEFDTAVHAECIQKALADDPEHAEAQAMRYLLED